MAALGAGSDIVIWPSVHKVAKMDGFAFPYTRSLPVLSSLSLAAQQLSVYGATSHLVGSGFRKGRKMCTSRVCITLKRGVCPATAQGAECWTKAQGSNFMVLKFDFQNMLDTNENLVCFELSVL